MTLNRTEAIDPAKVIRTIAYAHPVFTAAGAAAQARHDEISGRNRTHFCGAYWGWGFHEDGVVSARRASPSGSEASRCDAQRALRGHDPPPPLRGAPARVPAPDRAGLPRPRRAAGAARRPARRRRPGLVRFRRATTSATRASRSPTPCASSSATARAAADPRCSRSLRTLGHCFNPVSFYYCFDDDGERSAPSSPRSRTRRGASATPTCSTRRGGGTERRQGAARLAVHGHGPALRRARVARPGATLSVHIESRERRRARVRRDARPRAARPARAGALLGATLRTLAADLRATRVALKLEGRPAPPHPRGGCVIERSPAARRALLRAHRVRPARRSSRTAARHVFGAGAPHATVDVHAPRAWRALLRGSRGLAESYADGLWDSPDLTAVIRGRRAQRRTGSTRSRRRLDARCASRTSARARSCATRRARSRAGHRRPLRPRQRPVRADARPDDDVLVRDLRAPRHDARGGVAGQARARSATSSTSARPTTCSRSAPAGAASRVHAAATRGCRVTTTTISREQRALALGARARGRPRGPRDGPARRLPRARRPLRQARLDRDDRGRRLEGLRHVLRALLGRCSSPTARCCCRRSRSTTAPTTVEKASASVHPHALIFPNGCLPSVEVIARCVARRTDLRMVAPRGHHAALRRDAAALARERRARRRAARGARLRRALPAPVAAVPVLLRGGLRRAPDRRRAVVLAKPRWRAQRQRVSSQMSLPPYSAAASSTSAGRGHAGELIGGRRGGGQRRRAARVERVRAHQRAGAPVAVVQARARGRTRARPPTRSAAAGRR